MFFYLSTFIMELLRYRQRSAGWSLEEKSWNCQRRVYAAHHPPGEIPPQKRKAHGVGGGACDPFLFSLSCRINVPQAP